MLNNYLFILCILFDVTQKIQKTRYNKKINIPINYLRKKIFILLI